eukprot:jgi/Botrbrau1/21838/Bobra.0190s0052.1
MGDNAGAGRVRFVDKGQAVDSGGYEEAPSEVGPALSVISGISHANSAAVTYTMSRAGSASLSEFSTITRRRDDEERPPATIHEAAERGLLKDIVRMVERTLDFEVDTRDRYGRTALMWAAEQAHVNAAATLLDMGADRRATDPQTSRTALHLAARAASPDMLKVLLEDLPVQEREEYVNEPDRNGITPVFLAKQKGEEGLEAFEYLLACGARYNQQAWKELGSLPPAPPDAVTPTDTPHVARW